jgi:hypothetical protein
MHKQGIHDGHVDSRAEERGAVYGGFRERRSKRRQASLGGRKRFPLKVVLLVFETLVSVYVHVYDSEYSSTWYTCTYVHGRLE